MNTQLKINETDTVLLIKTNMRKFTEDQIKSAKLVAVESALGFWVICKPANIRPHCVTPNQIKKLAQKYSRASVPQPGAAPVEQGKQPAQAGQSGPNAQPLTPKGRIP